MFPASGRCEPRSLVEQSSASVCSWLLSEVAEFDTMSEGKANAIRIALRRGLTTQLVRIII